MLSAVESLPSVWDRLERAGLPIMLYGMGDGADKILRELARRGLRAAEIFASDEFVRGHSFRGYPVRRFSEICAQYERFIILVAFGTRDPGVMARLARMEAQFELYAPDVPVVGGAAFDLAFFRAHRSEFSRAAALLADEQSRFVFLNSLCYKITGKLAYLRACESPPDEVYRALLRPTKAETYLDLGAYDGDTIREFLRYTNGRAQKIIALEPDAYNFKKLCKKTERVTCLHAGAWSEDCTMQFSGRRGRGCALGTGVETTMRAVDSVLSGAPASYIKLDVEGAEYEALCGARNTIARFRPKLLCAAYHRNEDLFRLPLLIHALHPGYRLYLRHFPCVPAWETNWIAIEKEEWKEW